MALLKWSMAAASVAGLAGLSPRQCSSASNFCLPTSTPFKLYPSPSSPSHHTHEAPVSIASVFMFFVTVHWDNHMHCLSSSVHLATEGRTAHALSARLASCKRGAAMPQSMLSTIPRGVKGSGACHLLGSRPWLSPCLHMGFSARCATASGRPYSCLWTSTWAARFSLLTWISGLLLIPED